ncbi:B3/4 domain-containing protein [Acetonema longum]|uniref:B3/4 domain protein n=1 Tax=Acetonema longum DSM 6540 TaxID=1009370 RepID=F7NNB1_9FIRM|nr:phenylalanine--tRNA ligase beta subunit-related protein [Acetonema longum]EGO62496.1 B3/4 domain protein [Acetonema longum DSM 6540]
MKISISDEIKIVCPGTVLGILHYKVTVEPSSTKLLDIFDSAIAKLSDEYTLDAIVQNPHIAATRQAYKALGKSPHEYRNAAEAMLRRIIKNSELYHINNVVEVNNLISVSSGYSIGSYDLGELKGAVELRRAEDGTHYDGIGKGSVNIEHLPVLYDDLGPFGNPSSDSCRAMIQSGNRNVISVFYSFDGRKGLKPWIEQFSANLEQYCGVRGIEIWIV